METIEPNLWEVVKLFYKQNFDIPEIVIDYIAVEPILIKSLSGYSNTRIAQSMQDSVDYISGILSDFLRFDGWNEDLDFNPLAFYNKSKGNLNLYREEILQNSVVSNVRMIDKTFYLCRNYYNEIKKEINKYGEN